ncbi:MAG TPA: hypothetical protein VFZ21_10375 [Gemmatimonadaceae bacterium]|jgi:hypothetical protein|nr:hypothetical protein [Gemmatimonadaceae bacterium]
MLLADTSALLERASDATTFAAAEITLGGTDTRCIEEYGAEDGVTDPAPPA